MKGVPLNMCSLKFGQPEILNKDMNHYNDKEDQHHHLISIANLLRITFIKKITLS